MPALRRLVPRARIGDRGPPARLGARGAFHSRPVLLVAFAFAVMADPVSSVAYAIEAALRELRGNLGLLLPAMGLVVAIIALVITNYHQLVARFPEGGGAAAAAGKAFGEGWAFVPIGALIVDFVLTIAISAAAGASAVIDYVPGLAPERIPLALLLLLFVAGLTWFGHLGRAIFAAMTLAFVAAGVAVLVGGLSAPVANVGRVTHSSGHPAGIAVLLAFPVAMALATGVEAPSSAIAQLGQLDNAGRRRFGRVTLWLTLGIVGTLTLGLTAAAVRLKVGIPRRTPLRSAISRRPASATACSRSFSSRPRCCCWRRRARRFRLGRVCSRRWPAAGSLTTSMSGSSPPGWDAATTITPRTGRWSCS